MNTSVTALSDHYREFCLAASLQNATACKFVHAAYKIFLLYIYIKCWPLSTLFSNHKNLTSLLLDSYKSWCTKDSKGGS